MVIDMDMDELQEIMVMVHQRMTDIKVANKGEWPKGTAGAIHLTSEEAQAVMSALETAGEL